MKNVIALILGLMIYGSCGVEKNPCDVYSKLIGEYGNSHTDGKMIFTKGGMEGTIDIVGKDFNEMVCNYVILNCEDGSANMNCAGSPFDTKIEALSPDSVRINNILYVKLR